MEFNNDQKAAIRRAVDGFLEKDLPGLTIIGEGGTGKTTCVMDIAAQLIKAGLKVLFTAPTNKAVKQLEKSAKRYGLTLNNVAFQTLHSALGLRNHRRQHRHRLPRPPRDHRQDGVQRVREAQQGRLRPGFWRACHPVQGRRDHRRTRP